MSVREVAVAGIKPALLILFLVALSAPAVAAAPKLAKPVEVGGKPGQKAPNFTLDDLDDNKWTLYDLKAVPVTVLYFMGTECPFANRYIGRLNDLNLTYLRKNVLVLAINPNSAESVAAIRKHAKDYGLTVNVLLDRDQRLADRLGVEVTPTAIVLDSSFRVRYRGLFDDNPTAAHVKKPYVRNAVEAILFGGKINEKETEPWGCMVQRADQKTKPSDVTYTGQVARLLDRQCVTCHRPGESGPFSLAGYEAARRWAKTAKVFTQSRRMPPWRAAPHGLFSNEMGMTAAEIAALGRWADAGAPRGEGKEPQVPKAKDSALGKPDLVLETPSYRTQTSGDDEYRCFVLRTGLTADTWVRALEVLPGNKQVVRNVTVYADSSGAADKLAAAGPGPGYPSAGTGPGFAPAMQVASWSPGQGPLVLPDGTGWLLRSSARLVVQVQYHPTGRRETARTRLDLSFAKKPIRRPLRWLEVANTKFQLAAGRAGQRVIAQLKVAEDIQALAITPRMHYMGREMKVEAKLPDGRPKVLLLHVRNWDFHWRETYHFKSPMPLPKGTRLLLEAVYDTSLDNPNTPPDLPKTIVSGQRTSDEACAVWIGYY